MYSLNVPVPRRVGRLASGLAARCQSAQVKTNHTLVVKRLGSGDPRMLTPRLRDAITGMAPFAARVGEVDTFEQPASSPAPVVYLRVESPGVITLHEELCQEFEPVSELEAAAYVPHVTIARGGDARRATGEEIDPITWTVDRLVLRENKYGEPIGSLSLPAEPR